MCPSSPAGPWVASTKVRAFLEWADAHGLTSYSIGVAAPSITVSFVRNTCAEAQGAAGDDAVDRGTTGIRVPDRLAGAHGWAFGGFVDIVSREQVVKS
jgi:hypothetical protein